MLARLSRRTSIAARGHGGSIGVERTCPDRRPAELPLEMRPNRHAAGVTVAGAQTLDRSRERVGIAGRKQRTDAPATRDRAERWDVGHRRSDAERDRLDEREAGDFPMATDDEQVGGPVE